MTEKIKNIAYITSLFVAKTYWKITRLKTHGGRIMLICGNEILLVRHRRSRFWNLPGGGISSHKDPIQETLRELYEETKIKIDHIDYQLGRYDASAEGKRDTVFIFVKQIMEKIQPKISFELQDAQWFDINHLPETTSPATRSRVHEYRQGLQQVDRSW